MAHKIINSNNNNNKTQSLVSRNGQYNCGQCRVLKKSRKEVQEAATKDIKGLYHMSEQRPVSPYDPLKELVSDLPGELRPPPSSLYRRTIVQASSGGLSISKVNSS